MKNNFKINYKSILFCVLITFFMCLPFLNNGIPYARDCLFHISRIEGLATSIANGELLPSIYPFKFGGYGYGLPLFYSDTLLILPAILYNLGIPIIYSYQILVGVITFFTGISMFCFIDKFKFHKYAPYLGTTMYVFANYRLTSVFVRTAIGEVFAFMFIPIVLIGIVNVLYKNHNNWFPLAFGFLGLALSHNITFVIVCIMFAVYLVLYYKNLIDDKKRVVSIVKAILLVVCLSAFFTFGMLEQMIFQDFRFETITLFEDSLVLTALRPWQFFKNELIFGQTGTIESSCVFSIGILAMIIPFFHFFIINRNSNDDYKFVSKSLLVGVMFLIICTSLVPWEFLTFLEMIQFAFRFLIVPCVLLCFVASIYYFEIFKNNKILNVLLILFFTINSFHLLSPVINEDIVYDGSIKYHPTDSEPGLYSYQSKPPFEQAEYDYLSPEFIDYLDPPNYITDINKNKIESDCTKNYHETIYEINFIGDIIVPIAYYKGYKVKITNLDNGFQEVVDAKMMDGKILVSIAGNSKVEIFYENTLIKNIGILLTFTTLIIMCVWFKKNLKEKIILNNRNVSN